MVQNKVNPIIEGMGYEVVEVEYAKKIDGMNLTFFIDKVGGIKIDDCEKVHRAIDNQLDELNPTADEKYILSVSSVGLDRPIKTDKDLQRNIGKEVDIKLYVPINKKKDYTGILIAFDSESVIINAEEKEIKLPRKLIGNIVLHLEF
ncbi:MAG: ribosome maturation factor RimP [Clostridia bacterium]|nr:ribosome maturation factor RimP [Clostridia bacterium]